MLKPERDPPPRGGYREVTYIEPWSRHEVYGASGWWWYCEQDTAERFFPNLETRPTGNPMFVQVIGLSGRKLAGRGFIR